MLIDLCDILYKNYGILGPDSAMSRFQHDPFLNSPAGVVLAAVFAGVSYGYVHYCNRIATQNRMFNALGEWDPIDERPAIPTEEPLALV